MNIIQKTFNVTIMLRFRLCIQRILTFNFIANSDVTYLFIVRKGKAEITGTAKTNINIIVGALENNARINYRYDCEATPSTVENILTY